MFICDRWVTSTIVGSIRAKIWKVKPSHPGGVLEYMKRNDMLTLDDVIRTPDTNHIVHREFDNTSLFYDYQWWETLVARNLLERCQLQFGYVQDISRLVRVVPS